MRAVPGMAAGMLALSLAAAWAAPAELPPASYAGRQFVDSTGCVFLREGNGWTARLDRENRPICGYDPTVLPEGARLSGPFAPPPAPPPVLLTTAQTVPGALTGCPNLPVLAQRYGLSDGRVVMRCGPQVDDPVGFINGAGVVGLQVAGRAPSAMALPATAEMVAGIGPLLAPRPAAPARAPAAVAEPRLPVPAGERFVQIGAFARAANADKVKARLHALGLPVATGTARIGGRTVQVVYAGPFDDEGAACALDKVKADGFRDAILR